MSSGRLELMRQDVAAVICACQGMKNCPFQEFLFEDNVFGFTYIDLKGQLPPKQVTLNFSEDYPEQTVVTWASEADNPQISDERIQILFNRIAQDMNVDVRVPFSDPDADADMASSNSHPTVERTHSNSSHYSDCNSDITSDEYDYDDYYKDKDSDDEDLTMHPLLAQEIEIVQASFGPKSISHRLFGTIDDIDVELHIGMSFLDAEIAKAWKVIREEPIVVRLHLSLSRYLDATEPKVEVFQPSQKEKFGIGNQLRKILEQFVSDTWKNITNDLVEAKLAKSARPRKVGTSITKKRFQSQVSTIFGSVTQKLRGLVMPKVDKRRRRSGSRSPSSPEASSRPPEKAGVGEDRVAGAQLQDQSMALIMEMGFSEDMARNALIITHGNVEEALNLVLSSPESLVCGSQLEDGHFRPALELTSPGPVPPMPPMPHGKGVRGARADMSLTKAMKDKGRSKTAFSRQVSGADLGDGGGASSSLGDLNLLPSSTQSGMNAKQVPDLDNGFLVQVMQYTRQRLPTLNEYCVVCDEPHVFQNGAMLKPAVCARELCVFGFQTLGVMSDAAEDIATGAEVVDLLIAMAVAACRSHRSEVIFDPYPTVVDPTSPTELALNPKKKDYKRCEKAMEGFMEMKEMMSLVGSDLKKEMDTLDPLSYPLLQWIITSNRSHIVKLPPEKQISFMHTPHQFLLMSSPPAKEAVFRAARQQHNSTFAFHGSHIENWHSIMRVGLINATGTKHQVHGAAYGKGIYLSPHASVSFGYSGMGYGNHKAQKCNRVDRKSSSRFLNSKNLTCIALCEVITDKDLRKHNNIWVQPHADYCCTRFFFVYEDGQVGDSNIDTQNEKYKREIMRAVGYQTR